ncbi:MAG: fibronectin type III domain-containing protein [Acetivibrionales bacterium]
MIKKILSMLLVLSMLLTMLPMTVMAQEENTTNDIREEIIAFESLDETEKIVSVGTSLEDLELPEALTVTVRTNPETVTDSVYGFEEETTVDIPVTWISQPEYDMDTEDNYVFTPVIESYTVSAELPQINVTVEAQMAPMMMLSMGAPTEVGSFDELKNAINNATEDLNIKLTADIDYTGATALTIPDTKSINITIDLNDKTYSSSRVEAVRHNGTGTLTIEDNGEEGKGMIKTLAAAGYTITVNNRDAQLVINSGTVENQYGSNDGAALYFADNMMNSTIDINGGTINCLKGNGIYAYNNKIINIYDGTIKGAKRGIHTNSVLKIYGGTIEGTDETSNAIYTTGEVTVTGGTVKAVGTGATIDQRGSAKLNISGGKIENTGSGPAISSSLSSTNGSFTIGGDAEIISNNPDSDSGTIYVSGSQGSLLIAGAKVVNTSETGNAIFCENPIRANIRSGNTEIKGGNLAIKGLAPIVRLNMKGIASRDYIGEDTEDYQADNIGSYKFLQFEPNTADVAQIGEMTYPTLQEAIDAVDVNTTIKLLENIALDEAIDTKSKSFILDLNGKIIDGEEDTVIAHNAGKLTIKDDAGGGMIFSAGKYTIAMENEGAELEINNVTLENYYTQAYAEYNKGDAIYVNKGTLNINDSTIRSNENGVFSIESTLGINGSNIDGNIGLYIRTKSVVNVIDSTVYGTEKGIENDFSGSVMNIDRSIIRSDDIAIRTLWGTYTITDSTVESAGNEATIHCANDKVTLNIIGGTIENTGNGCAIFEDPGESGTVNSVSDITISGGAVITSQNPDPNSGTIYVWNERSSFKLYGATVTNTSSTGNAIFSGDSIKANIRNGNNLIYGGNLAIKGVAPIVRLGMKGMASSDFDGDDQEDYSADKINSYKFLKFEPKYVAQVGGGDTYTSLQEAIDVVDDNTTIKLLENIALDEKETIDTEGKSFILDLNGKIMDGENGTAIEQNGGTMTIEDNVGTGMITSKGAYSTIKLTNDSRLIITGGTISHSGKGTSTIHHNSTGSLEVKGGTVDNTYYSNNSYTIRAVIHSTGSGDVIVDGGTVKCNKNDSNMRVIYNASNGDVTVSAGTVEVLAGNAIANNGNGNVIISGGTVKSLSDSTYESTIYNAENGNVSISGGTVEAYLGRAIHNNKIGKITISGEAEIISQSSYGTIYLIAGTADDTVLEITGGTISNDYDYGTAIYNNASGKISIQGGTCIIWGKSKAMNEMTVLVGELRIMASTSHTDGTNVYPVNAEALTSGNITNYKYLRFEPATVPDAPTNVTATAGDGKATVSFTAPAFDGGSEITGYTVKSNPGGITATGTTTEIEVTGLTNGVSYTFTVTATNSVGESLASSESNSVTPKGNQTITFINPGDQDFGTELTLSATASSGLPVTYTSETPEVCTVTSDGEVTFLKVGTATIKASQEGNAAYLAAEPVTQ